MLKIEKNLFFDEIAARQQDPARQLDPMLFTATDLPPGAFGHATYSSGLEIRVIGTGLVFRAKKFDAMFSGRNYRCEATTFDLDTEAVTSEVVDHGWQREYNLSAGHAAKCFGDWLDNDVALYLAERDAPDMWQQLRDAQSFVGLSLDDTEEIYFTDDEQQYLRTEALPRIRRFIVERFDPAEDFLTQMDKRLAYIAEAVDRPRFDFFGLLMGFALGVATNLSISKEDGAALWQFITDTLAATGRLLSGS